jgi:hypothetical protein
MEPLDVDVLRGRARPDELDHVHCCSLSAFSADVLMAVFAAMHTRPAAPRQRLAALGHHRRRWHREVHVDGKCFSVKVFDYLESFPQSLPSEFGSVKLEMRAAFAAVQRDMGFAWQRPPRPLPALQTSKR